MTSSPALSPGPSLPGAAMEEGVRLQLLALHSVHHSPHQPDTRAGLVPRAEEEDRTVKPQAPQLRDIQAVG